VHLFDSFLVREDCVKDLKTLEQQPNVKHVLRLPRDWIFYEFHHELFKDPDFLVEGIWREKMQLFPELRQARIEMLNQERALLAPWYAKKKKLGDADALLASEICPYRVSSLTRMRWIDFLPAMGWGSVWECAITLDPVDITFPPLLYQLMEEWAASGKAAGELRLPFGLPPVKTGPLALHMQCSSYSGHWLVILWVLLSDVRWKTGVRSMHVGVSSSLR
jgi:hypothetical protein